MPRCTVKLRAGKTCTFPGATGEEDGFSLPPKEAERVNPDPDPFA